MENVALLMLVLGGILDCLSHRLQIWEPLCLNSISQKDAGWLARLHSFSLVIYRSKSSMIFSWNVLLFGAIADSILTPLRRMRACVGFSFFVTCHVVWWWRHTLYHVIHTHAMWPLCHVVSMFTFRLRDSFFTFFRRLILRKKRLKLLLSHTWGCRLQKFQI